VTQVIAFEGDGKLQEYVGGYEDWVRVQKFQAGQAANKSAASTPPKVAAAAVEKPKAGTKLNFKENRELEELPKQVELLEQEQVDIVAHLADGTIFRSDVKRAKQLQSRSEEIDGRVLELMARWEALEKKSNG
jgi:ATP-binding cassette subfamily F protein uup